MRNILGIILVAGIITTSFGQTDRPEQPDIPGEFLVDVGLNGLYNNQDLNLRTFRSRTVGVYYMYTRKLGDRFSVNPMLGVSVDRYSFKSKVNFVQQEDRTFAFDTLDDLNLQKSLLSVVYLELPLEVRFYPFKTLSGEGPFVGLGGMAGLRIKSYTKVKYKQGGDRRVDKNAAPFGLTNFRYGVQGRLGFKTANVFFKYYLSDLFENVPEPLNSNPGTFTIGINFTGF